jgi:hypothetical protein
MRGCRRCKEHEETGRTLFLTPILLLSSQNPSPAIFKTALFFNEETTIDSSCKVIFMLGAVFGTLFFLLERVLFITVFLREEEEEEEEGEKETEEEEEEGEREGLITPSLEDLRSRSYSSSVFPNIIFLLLLLLLLNE